MICQVVNKKKPEDFSPGFLVEVNKKQLSFLDRCRSCSKLLG